VSTGRRSVCVAAVASGIFMAATPASAGFVAISSHGTGTQLQVGGGAEANDIEITRNGATYVVTDGAGTLTAGQGCSGGGTMATCPDPSGSVVRVIASTDALNDVVRLNADIPGVLIGGPGPDTLFGGPAKDRIGGGGDADRLVGGDSPDRLDGGNKDDTLVGGAGKDRLFGDNGSDRLKARDGQRDLVDGGRGRDRARVDAKDRVRGVEQVA
jgi:Ca2+-binding RTX toxin-like protein